MKSKLKILSLVISCVIIILLFWIWLLTGTKKSVASVHSKVFTVVIDAGHGGIDGGVSGLKTSVKESDLNLEVARLLKSKFQEAGISVVMTRNSYGGLYGTTARGFKKRDLEKRVKIINSANADAMISIHHNFYSSPTRRGATTFFGNGKIEGEKLAKSIQKHFNELSGQMREYYALQGDYYLLNQSNCPSVICECGFLSNAEEESLLITSEYQKEIVDKIFFGVIEYLSI